MDSFLLKNSRRRFMQRCGLLALGALFPIFFNFRSRRATGEYVMVNGWVLPVDHLVSNPDD
jgi:hypothetical protein